MSLAPAIVLHMFDMPTTLIDYCCTLEAVNRDYNVARSYRIRATRDLFGHTIVDLRWGRIGRHSAGLTVSFACEEAARRFIRKVLAKRASAPARIGVAYTVIDELGCGVAPIESAANENR
jgi:predicted DNA-binding WGR domain protein